MTGPLKSQPYNWIDKHSIVDEIRTAIQDSGEPVEYIAKAANVSRATIDNWLMGRTRKPYSTSVEAVARALGKRLTLVDGELHLEAPPRVSPALSSRHIVQMSKYRRYP